MLKPPASLVALLIAGLMLVSTACQQSQPASPTESAQPAAETVDLAEQQTRSELAAKPWKGDLDGMLERRVIRVLCPNSAMYYTTDRGKPSGLTYELFHALEDKLNKDRGALKVHMVFIPSSRDRLLPELLEGRGDIAAGNLTITPTRQEQFDFSTPLIRDVSQVVVTGPTGPAIAATADLSGKEVMVRKSSSYYESLEKLNRDFAQQGAAPVVITPADENLEDEDLLEMVNGGLVQATVTDSHVAEFWGQAFDKLVVHKDVAVATGGEIAWAFRKESPKLAEALNAFAAESGLGTALGNTLKKRYLTDTKWVRNAAAAEEVEKLGALKQYFEKYGEEYQLEWILLAAQGYQESQLDQTVRSPVGAVGIMQLMPTTAADPAVGIPNVDTNPENNIHAGAKYLRYVIKTNFADANLDKLNATLFAIASYNAGPARVAKLRAKAEARGLDPNVWFHNVEYIAAEEIGRETVTYVSNIYKYYVTYKRLVAARSVRDEARQKALGK